MVISFSELYNVVKLLLAKPEIDVNLKDKWGRTALMLASEEGHTEIANLIKSHPNFDMAGL